MVSIEWDKGFTLIELIVVMAILGILATVAIVAVNPTEQLAKARDASRISSITQLGGSLESYHSSNVGVYPQSPSTTWMNILVSHGDLRGEVVNASYNSGNGCNDMAVLGQNGFCYNNGSIDTIIYAKLEAWVHNRNCTSAPNTRAYWLYYTSKGKACVVCAQESTDPGVASSIICSF